MNHEQQIPAWALVITAAISALPPTIMAVLALLQGLRNGSNIRAVHLDLNSRLSEMLEMNRTAAFAEGQKFQSDKGRVRGEGNSLEPGQPGA